MLEIVVIIIIVLLLVCLWDNSKQTHRLQQRYENCLHTLDKNGLLESQHTRN